MPIANVRKSRTDNPRRYADLILNDPKRRLIQARLMIENPLWDAMFEDMKKDLFTGFCEDIDLQSRERIALAVDLLDDLKDRIESYVQFGKPLKIVNTGDSDGS